ncbi:MAG: hypothetical protein WAN33_11750 [Candidatus Acidiferrales bacterium]
MRESDGRTLAIEHTIIQPFAGEKQDLACFQKAFLQIEQDDSLKLPCCRITVFVPVGILENRKTSRDAIVQSMHRWIRENIATFGWGSANRQCPIVSKVGELLFETTLTVKMRHLPPNSPGSFFIRRQSIEDDTLANTVEKALREKLPKLVNTKADKRIFLIERQHMNLLPRFILEKIEERRDSFPSLMHIDEIWIVETPFYGTTFGGDWLYFEQYENGEVVNSFPFSHSQSLTL